MQERFNQIIRDLIDKIDVPLVDQEITEEAFYHGAQGIAYYAATLATAVKEACNWGCDESKFIHARCWACALLEELGLNDPPLTKQ